MLVISMDRMATSRAMLESVAGSNAFGKEKKLTNGDGNTIVRNEGDSSSWFLGGCHCECLVLLVCKMFVEGLVELVVKEVTV